MLNIDDVQNWHGVVACTVPLSRDRRPVLPQVVEAVSQR